MAASPTALRVYAVGIDEVRDLIGADPPTAEHARRSAASLVGGVSVGERGRLKKLLRRPAPATLRRADSPTVADLNIVLQGRYAPPERATACWTVLEHLIADMAWGCLALDLDARGVADLDFAMARVGGSAELSVGRWLRSDARICLTRDPGLCVGYVPHSAVRDSGARLSGLDLTADPMQATAGALTDFLGSFPLWADEAARAGRPVPDLVAFHRTAASVS